ncbi:hypothetical protein M0R45_034545 [Rubus argutus]|uniref:Protein kinase domain-containing protein n=1 Tax=Rubus argutus TaxID=59490 RepID=A0AAW1VSU2_RUBAR
MHFQGANILVDVQGRVKLEDFGVSKQATVSGANWVHLTGWLLKSFSRLVNVVMACNSADIWSAGCTVIEIVTGKPPWSEKFREGGSYDLLISVNVV